MAGNDHPKSASRHDLRLGHVDAIMGNSATQCCSGKNRSAKHKNRPKKRATDSNSNDSGMTPPFPALDVLRQDVDTAQEWLDQTLAKLHGLELPPTGRPPDAKAICKSIEKLKKIAKDFLQRSFETDELLSHSHAWLDQDRYRDTTFDLDIARLEYSWSQVRDKLSALASEYDCEELQSDLARDLSAQGGDGFSPTPSSSHIPRSRLINRRRTNPDGAQGHQPKHKRRFVPHLTWQYRAVIKSRVKFRERTPRGSILGSETSESGSVYSDQVFVPRRPQRSDSSSTLSLPTVIGPGFREVSSTSLTSLSDAERHAQFKPGYKDNPSSDSLVSRDLNSNTVRVKQRIKAIRARKQRKEPSNQLSLVRFASNSSEDTKEVYVDLTTPPRAGCPPDSDQQLYSMEDWNKVKESRVPDTELVPDDPYPVRSEFGKMSRSRGIHEGLTSLALPGSGQGSGNSTPRSRSHRGHVGTPVGQFLPPEMSTPIQQGASKCPHTPVEIRKFLGTNNSATGRSSPDGQLTADFSDNSSNVSSLAHSPTGESQRDIRKDLKRKYQKDELWRAIKSDYHYLMDEDIIEQCRSTDSDLSWDDEEVKNTVTFTDFIQQYNELMEWLNQIQMFTQRQGSSLSEKYLNQSYYEEMLERSPRRKLFNDYAKQLMRRYPNMRDEITVRLTHLNNQWERLQKTVAPSDGLRDRDTMLRDLALDLRGLALWVSRIETTLQPRSLDTNLSLQELQSMLKDHETLQQDIECHSKVVSAVLKLCERLHSGDESVMSPSEELQIKALNLERRWHSIWLQSLEWQCRLEEAVNTRTSLLGRSLSDSHTRGLNNSSTYSQSDSRLDNTYDESEAGLHNDQSSQISETSNAQTVTHDKAPSPGTSTLGRPKKEQPSWQSEDVETAQDCEELPDPTTHTLIADTEPGGDDYQVACAPPTEDKVRHWSDSAFSRPGAVVISRQCSNERKRRYSDSANITIDSPSAEYSPLLRSKSLDDLSKRQLLIKSLSSGSLDRISDDSDDLFDETERLLQSVASELRTYESFSDNIDDDEEFFLYTKDGTEHLAPHSLLARYSTEAGLESVLEEESDEMSSPRNSYRHSPGERVFASPKVKKFLQLQSFSNTISPAGTPPGSTRDSNVESDAESRVEEGNLSLLNGQLVVGVNNENQPTSDNLRDYSYTDDYYYDSSGSSSAYGGTKSSAPLNLSRYAHREDLSQLLVGDSPVTSDLDTDNPSRLSLSPGELRTYSPFPTESSNNNNNDNREQKTMDSTDFGWCESAPIESTTVVLDIATPPKVIKRHGAVLKTELKIQTKPTSEFTPEQPAQPARLPTVEEHSPSPVMVVTLQSSVKEEDEGLTSVKTPLALNQSDSRVQMDLSDLTDSDSRTNKERPKLGPRSVTISGLNVQQELPQPSDRKYRRVGSVRRRLQQPGSPVFVSTATVRPHPSAELSHSATVDSPVGLISKGGFFLKDDVVEETISKNQFNIYNTGSMILTPSKRRTITSLDSEFHLIRGPTDLLSPEYPGSHVSRTSRGVRSSPGFSALQDQYSTHKAPLSHTAGSGDQDARSCAIWETEVGLPANWSSINVDERSLASGGDDVSSPQKTTPARSRSSSSSSSESFSTGFLTPTRSYLKVTSVQAPEEKAPDFSETIYINPSEITKSAQEVAVTPSENIPESSSSGTSSVVTGIEQITTTIKPGTRARKTLVPKQSSHDTTVKFSSTHDDSSSDGEQTPRSSLQSSAYQDNEFTTVSLDRETAADDDVPTPERVNRTPKSRYTSQASLAFLPGTQLEYQETVTAVEKFVGSHRPTTGEEEDGVNQLKQSNQSVVLSRKPSGKPLTGQENATPTKLQFTTASIDNSGDAGDLDLESRKAKVGTVYRILDDGNVVRESDLNSENLSGDASSSPHQNSHISTAPTDDSPVTAPAGSISAANTDDSPITAPAGNISPSNTDDSPMTAPAGTICSSNTDDSLETAPTDTVSATPNDLSTTNTNRALKLIHELLPDDSGDVNDQQTDVQITLSPPTPQPIESAEGHSTEVKDTSAQRDHVSPDTSLPPSDTTSPVSGTRLPTDITSLPEVVISLPDGDVQLLATASIQDDNETSPGVVTSLPDSNDSSLECNPILPGTEDDLHGDVRKDSTALEADAALPDVEPSQQNEQSKAQILAELEAMGDDDSTEAVSLFNLITSMSPPEDVSETLSSAVLPELTSGAEEQRLPQGDTMFHPDVCDSPLSDPFSSEQMPLSSEDDVFRPMNDNSPRDDPIGKGLGQEEPISSDSGQEGAISGDSEPDELVSGDSEQEGPISGDSEPDEPVSGDSEQEGPISGDSEQDEPHRPIRDNFECDDQTTGDSEYDSESLTYEEHVETHRTTDLTSSAVNAERTFRPIEPVIGTTCTPFEACTEQLIVPQARRNCLAEVVAPQQDVPVAQQLSPMSLCNDMMVGMSPPSLERCLEGALEAAVLEETLCGPEKAQVTEEDIVPGRNGSVQKPTVSAEPAPENVEIERLNGYSDVEELSDTLENVEEMPSAVKQVSTHASDISTAENGFSAIQQSIVTAKPTHENVEVDERLSGYSDVEESSDTLENVEEMPSAVKQVSPDVSDITTTENGFSTIQLPIVTAEPIADNVEVDDRLSGYSDAEELSDTLEKVEEVPSTVTDVAKPVSLPPLEDLATEEVTAHPLLSELELAGSPSDTPVAIRDVQPPVTDLTASDVETTQQDSSLDGSNDSTISVGQIPAVSVTRLPIPPSIDTQEETSANVIPDRPPSMETTQQAAITDKTTPNICIRPANQDISDTSVTTTPMTNKAPADDVMAHSDSPSDDVIANSDEPADDDDAASANTADPVDNDSTEIPAIAVIPSASDSDAFDGDESSEGEEDDVPQRNTEVCLPSSSVLETPQLVTGWVSPSSDEQFTRESSVETLKNTAGAELVRESSSSDPPLKATPTKRRRKRRPRTLTGSPKTQASDLTPSPPASPVKTFQATNVLSPTNQWAGNASHDLSPDESHDVSPELSADELSDVVSSDNGELMNSTGLSEGSNWDYYQAKSTPVQTAQDPPYSTGTDPDFDIDLEPKLDDSVLQWDDELDDNNDTLTLEQSRRKTRLPVVTGAAAAAAASDSEDSDIEDLHYVIQQSSTQLLQADSALRKPRRDVVQSGIYLDPQKYIEWHATCQTNVKCLQVIQEHLESEQGLANLTDDDIQQVLDLIKKWQSLEKIALERKDQSSALCKIYRDILSGKKLVKLCEEQLATPAFNDVAELENHFRSLQTFRVNLQSQSHRLQQVTDSILVFESENKKIKMAGFKQLVAELSTAVKPTVLSVGRKTTELQYAIVHWHKWNGDCKELETILVKTSYDIEPVELTLCEQRLVELEASFSEFSSVCTDAAHNFTEEKLTALRTRLNHLMADNAQPIAAEGLDTATLSDEEVEGATEGESMPTDLRPPPYADDDGSAVASGSSPTSLSLDVNPDPLASFKSSMESGFGTMDTERSLGDESVDRMSQQGSRSGSIREGLESGIGSMQDEELPGDGQQTVEDSDSMGVVPKQSSADVLTATDPAHLSPTKSLATIPIVTSSSDADTHSSTPTTDILSAILDADLSSISAAVAAADPTYSLPARSLHEPPSASGPMSPLTVNVNHGNDTGNSDHQTPPTVEELAPTLPITDQEKIHVANRSRRNKKNRRKGKSKNQSQAAPSDQSQSLTAASSSNQTDFNKSCDQSTATDSVPVESIELQTDNSRLFADSSTNTGVNSQTESQTDRIPTSDQSTHSDSQNVTSQGILTEATPTNESTNQTDLPTEQSTETEPVPVTSVTTDTESLHSIHYGVSSSRSTNTPTSSASACQTDSTRALAEGDGLYTDSVDTQTAADVYHSLPVDCAAYEYNTQESEEAQLVSPQPVRDDALPIPADDEALTGPSAVEEAVAEVHEPLVEEGVITQDALRHRGPPVGTLARLLVDEPVDDGAATKPVPRRRWFSPRTLKYLTAIVGSLLLLFVLLFLLQPRCCENTRYHEGILGLRRRYTDMPPH